MSFAAPLNLTADGQAVPVHQTRTLLVACGALARELLHIIEVNGWAHMTLVCLPANLHNRPDAIPAAVREIVLRHRRDYETILVVYADCGTGGALARTCAELDVEMLPGPHCYALFEGIQAFAAHEDEITAFYLTDFLVRQFDAFVWRPLGLDRHPELLEAYFSHYTKLVYLAQTDDPALDSRARDAAARLGLAYERRAVGYGDFPPLLGASV